MKKTLSCIKIYYPHSSHLCRMKIKSAQIIEELTVLTRSHLQQVQEMSQLPTDTLTAKPAPHSWNALECVEHLVRYGNFYLPEIEKQIKASPYPQATLFKSGWLGNYFAKSMLPRQKPNKMKTFKQMNPVNSGVKREVLLTFSSQLEKMLELLQMAARTDLTRVKTAISISAFIRLRLGDSMRVVIYHNERHLKQAGAAMKSK